MTLGAFLTVALIHLAAAMSPGPSFVVAARTAATDGFGTAFIQRAAAQGGTL